MKSSLSLSLFWFTPKRLVGSEHKLRTRYWFLVLAVVLCHWSESTRPEAYLGLFEQYMMKFYLKKYLTAKNRLKFSHKSSIIVVWQGFEYACANQCIFISQFYVSATWFDGVVLRQVLGRFFFILFSRLSRSQEVMKMKWIVFVWSKRKKSVQQLMHFLTQNPLNLLWKKFSIQQEK